MKVRVAFFLFYLGISLAACKSQGDAPNKVDLVGTAAAEATQLIQQAQATSLMHDAQKQATALIAGSTGQSIGSSTTPGAVNILPVPSPEVQSTLGAGGQVTPTQTPQGSTVEVLGVGIGTEGNFIEVYFLAPPAVAGGWYQGNVSVTDETTGIVYNEIPVMPVIGPLFGKPVEDGQKGYVMLVNAPEPLQLGTLVTVKLGDYIFEHILVK
jgi:hypothetical protein